MSFTSRVEQNKRKVMFISSSLLTEWSPIRYTHMNVLHAVGAAYLFLQKWSLPISFVGHSSSIANDWQELFFLSLTINNTPQMLQTGGSSSFLMRSSTASEIIDIVIKDIMYPVYKLHLLHATSEFLVLYKCLYLYGHLTETSNYLIIYSIQLGHFTNTYTDSKIHYFW